MTTKKTAPTTDLETLQTLVLWARQNKLLVSDLQVGSIHIQYADLAVATGALSEKSDRQAAETIYERYGKALLEAAEGEDEGSFTGLEDEDNPDAGNEDEHQVA